MFAGFGILWMGALPPRRRLAVMVGGLALAGISEVGQGLPIVERDPSVLDALADSVGLLAGIGAGGRRSPG